MRARDSGVAAVTPYADCRDDLLGRKRYEPLAPDDWTKAATALYRSADYRLYDLDIPSMVEKEIKVLGRTCVEACIDAHAKQMCSAVSRWASKLHTKPMVIDLFAGSANLLYQLIGHLDTNGFGLENDPKVFATTKRNLERLDRTDLLFNCSWELWKRIFTHKGPAPIVAVVDPPWGPAYDYEKGLDLGKTSPPIIDVLHHLRRHAGVPTVALVKTTDRLVDSSLNAIRSEFPQIFFGTSRGQEPGFNISFMLCSVIDSGPV